MNLNKRRWVKYKKTTAYIQSDIPEEQLIKFGYIPIRKLNKKDIKKIEDKQENKIIVKIEVGKFYLLL